ncbi:MAG: T9SS type A sorting domain-containing protein [Flavobacteriaceae bacterium]|nr:T9SS type A sorting domain-containing protein [Flavobacteriaceae bacterium]
MRKNYLIFFLFSFLTVAAFSQGNEIDQHIRLYPNPANNSFNIEYSNVNILKVEVYSIIGIKELELTDNYRNINISWLSRGIYMVKIYTDKGHLVKKLVKN